MERTPSTVLDLRTWHSKLFYCRCWRILVIVHSSVRLFQQVSFVIRGICGSLIILSFLVERARASARVGCGVGGKVCGSWRHRTRAWVQCKVHLSGILCAMWFVPVPVGTFFLLLLLLFSGTELLCPMRVCQDVCFFI